MTLLAVVLISYVVYTSECQAAEPVLCYECSTYSNDAYCADPFNLSHPHVKSVTCDSGACAKWVRKPKFGPQHFIRTCTSNLNLRLTIAMVCMKESRPGNGRLCFCSAKNCNGSQALSRPHPAMVLLAVITLSWIVTNPASFTPL